MANDDYHTIVFWLLSYLYKCLKTGMKPNPDTLYLMDYPYEINEDYKMYILTHIYNAGYIEGIQIKKLPVLGTGGKVFIHGIEKTMITPEGIDYLENNGAMQKAKEFAKQAAGPLATLFSTVF